MLMLTSGTARFKRVACCQQDSGSESARESVQSLVRDTGILLTTTVSAEFNGCESKLDHAAVFTAAIRQWRRHQGRRWTF